MITLFLNKLFSLVYSYIFMSLMYIFIIPTIYMYLSKNFSDHAIVIFPQPDRLDIRFRSDAV
jgi:glucose-6-phosphate-specific signal transduction histidine kinase